MTEIDHSRNGDGQPSTGKPGTVMAALDKNDLRSMFHLLVGKPDSTQQMFKRRVHVNIAAIHDLHGQMVEKLRNHRVEGMIATADVSFEDKTSLEFGTWAEFEQHRWTSPKVTREVRLRWEFLVTVDGYEVPQRHTVTVKLSPHLKPIDVMRAVLSKDPSEADSFEIESVPIFCRVDFVNHILSKELLALVDEWVHSLPQPAVENSWFSWFEERANPFCTLIRYSAPLLTALAALLCLSLVAPLGENPEAPLTKGYLVMIAQWAFVSLIILYVVDKSSGFIARKTFESIQKYGAFRMFKLTSGDDEGEQKLAQRNKKQVRNFLISSGFSLLINIIGGVIVYLGFTN